MEKALRMYVKITKLVNHFRCKEPMELIRRPDIREQLASVELCQYINGTYIPFGILYERDVNEYLFTAFHTSPSPGFYTRTLTNQWLRSTYIRETVYDAIVGRDTSINYSSSTLSEEPLVESKKEGPKSSNNNYLRDGITVLLIAGAIAIAFGPKVHKAYQDSKK